MRRRRNPDLVGDLVLLGALGVGIILIGNLVGGAVNSINPGQIVNKLLPPNTCDPCADMIDWINSLQPSNIVDQAIQSLFPPGYTWDEFRAWEHATRGCDPGPTPPACWYQRGSGFAQSTYEGTAPGGLGY